MIYYHLCDEEGYVFCQRYARVAQRWSISLPRRGSRVRFPSRAFFVLENRCEYMYTRIVETTYKGFKMSRCKKIISISFVLYIAFLVVILFMDHVFLRDVRLEGVYHGINTKPFSEISRYLNAYRDGTINRLYVIANLLGNFILFMPLVWYLEYFFSPFRNAIVCICVCCGISILVECAQFYTSTGSLDIDDIILNTAGCVTAYIIAYVYIIRRKHRKEEENS